MAKALFVVAMSLLLSGCLTYHPDGPLRPPSRFIEHPSDRSALIEKANVSDKDMDREERMVAAKSLTMELEKYITRAGYFKNVLTFPVKLAERDVLLKFEFSRLFTRRAPHPWYFPGAFFTATLWIWFNGPIHRDSTEVAGTLVIEDSLGKVLAKSENKVLSSHGVGMWDPDYMFIQDFGNMELTELVKQLLDSAVSRIDGDAP